MSLKPGFSLMQPSANIEYRTLPDHVMHDLGLDDFCKEISGDATERRMIANVLSGISSAISIGVPYMCTMESSSSVSCASVIRFFADALKRR